MWWLNQKQCQPQVNDRKTFLAESCLSFSLFSVDSTLLFFSQLMAGLTSGHTLRTVWPWIHLVSILPSSQTSPPFQRNWQNSLTIRVLVALLDLLKCSPSLDNRAARSGICFPVLDQMVVDKDICKMFMLVSRSEAFLEFVVLHWQMKAFYL